jgi:hypothetical protein
MAKNKFLFILAAVSLLSLAACGNANNSSSAASESSTSAKASSSNAESSSQKPTSEGLVFQLNDDKQSYRVSGYEGTGANVLIPETYESLPVTSIGNKAFCGNFRVQSVAFAANSSLTSIGERAFADCTVLASVSLPAALTSIGESAFDYCVALTSIALPASLTSIGEWAFFDCTSLTSVDLPASLTSIGMGAFAGCTSLTSVDLPASLTSIGDRAFVDCEGLVRFTVDPANESFETDGKALYDKGKTTLLQYAIGLTDSSYAVPTTVTSIGDWAFAYCTALASVALPASLTSIGERAFAYCTALASVALPASLTSIGEMAFEDCTSLDTVNYAGTKEQWGKVTFGSGWHEGCTLLKTITCSDGTVTL